MAGSTFWTRGDSSRNYCSVGFKGHGGNPVTIYCEKCRTRIASGNTCTTCGHLNPGRISETSGRQATTFPPQPPSYGAASNQLGVTPFPPSYQSQSQGYYQSGPTSSHGPAIASMVLGIISLVIWYLGIITGIIGLVLGASSLKHCQPHGPKNGRGMAIAGITCSIIALSLWLIVLVAIGAGSTA